MAQIPNQPIEFKCTIYTSAERKLAVTLFPLPSHSWEAPIDMLEGFINKRRGEFFPVRLADGSAMLIPLSDCWVFEVTREEEDELLSFHPEMNRDPVCRSAAHVASYAKVILTLKTGKRVQGSLWFYDYVPETKQNLLDALNSGTRYLLLHTRQKTIFVRIDSIARAEVKSSPTPPAAGPTDSQIRRLQESGLVDVKVDFADLREEQTGETPLYQNSPYDTPFFDQDSARQSLSGVFLKPSTSKELNLSRIANSQELPRPKKEDLE